MLFRTHPQDRILGIAMPGVSWSSAFTQGVSLSSTYPRQLLPEQHIHDPLAAEAGLQQHPAGGRLDHLPDTGTVHARRVAAHDGQQLVHPVFRHHRDQLALIGQVERVQAEDLAQAAPARRKYFVPILPAGSGMNAG